MDSPSPRVFGTVSPLDPQLFYGMNEFAADLLKGARSGKYTPVEVAQWIEDHAAAATSSLARAEDRVVGKDRPGYRRLAIDIAVSAGLGRFFGAKFRAGVLYHIFDRTGDRTALEKALESYRSAREAWVGIVARTRGVYMPDITVGELRQLRGHWADRLPDIDADIAAVEAKLGSARPAQTEGPVARAIAEALEHPPGRVVTGRHNPPERFQPGHALALEFTAEKEHASVRLHYRRVNQAERWQSEPMRSDGRLWRATIAADYTLSPYPLQYYFELRQAPDSAVLYPGFGGQLAGQPYFVVRRRPD
jgi:hypothetical protein